MTTTLPAPTAAAMTAAGRWPHMPALRAELIDLLDDLDLARIPARGEDAQWVAQDWADRGWRRIVVAVYAPLGRDEAIPGWLSPDHIDEALRRVLAHLPGARTADEELVGSSRTIHWGSRDPGWTPTAIPVRRSTSRLWREREQVWTAAEVVDHLGISTSTWEAYQSRRDAGVPIALGTIIEPDARGHRRAIRVWDAQAVQAWQDTRPGKGGRPARRP